jgi:predicted aldo/keto reductase-like oxidoreductase
MSVKPPALDRRRLLLYGLAGVTAGATGIIGYRAYREHRYRGVATRVSDRAPFVAPAGEVTQRRRLGRTGLDVSVVGIGAGGLEGTGPIHRAVAKGMNYIDTSCCYGRGGSETVIGNALRESAGLRQRLIIATKWDAGAQMPKDRMLASLDASLRRLGTDYVDIMQIHQLGDHLPGDDGFSRVDNPELYLAMEEAKRAGKVRFFGATGHTGQRSAILSHAIDKGAFDMILVKMNVLDFEEAGVPALLAKAREKDVGVVVLKSQPNGGMIPKGFEASKWNVYQANLRWVLEHDVTAVVHSGIGTDPDVQDSAIGAVHDAFTANDRGLLERYASALSPHYCRGCAGACTAACPDGIAVPAVLRAVMYDRHYGWPAQAAEAYAEIDPARRWSERCASCRACDAACPYGVDAAARVNEAHRRFG